MAPKVAASPGAGVQGGPQRAQRGGARQRRRQDNDTEDVHQDIEASDTSDNAESKLQEKSTKQRKMTEDVTQYTGRDTIDNDGGKKQGSTHSDTEGSDLTCGGGELAVAHTLAVLEARVALLLGDDSGSSYKEDPLESDGALQGQGQGQGEGPQGQGQGNEPEHIDGDIRASPNCLASVSNNNSAYAQSTINEFELQIGNIMAAIGKIQGVEGTIDDLTAKTEEVMQGVEERLAYNMQLEERLLRLLRTVDNRKADIVQAALKEHTKITHALIDDVKAKTQELDRQMDITAMVATRREELIHDHFQAIDSMILRWYTASPEELARLKHEMLSDSKPMSAIAEGKGEIKDKGS